MTVFFCFCKQKTAYEMRISDWSSDVCSSDLQDGAYALFTSTSGVIGNIGQANYGAAKLGVHGLSHIIAMENASCNVRANVIAPFAWTRMIGTIPVKDEASRVRVEIGRASCRERGGQYVSIQVVAVPFNKKTTK